MLWPVGTQKNRLNETNFELCLSGPSYDLIIVYLALVQM